MFYARIGNYLALLLLLLFPIESEAEEPQPAARSHRSHETAVAKMYVSKNPPPDAMIIANARKIDACQWVTDIWGKYGNDNTFQLYYGYVVTSDGKNHAYIGRGITLFRLDNNLWVINCTSGSVMNMKEGYGIVEARIVH